MPNATASSGRDTPRVSQASSNIKDPPRSRRDQVLDTILATLQASQQRLLTSLARRSLEDEFADHFKSWPRDEEYYTLLAKCRQTRLALGRANPSSTFTSMDALTSTLMQHSIHVEDSAHEDELESKKCSSPFLSSRTNACPFDLKRPKAAASAPTSGEVLRATLLVDDVKTQEDQLRRKRVVHAINQESRDLSPTNTTGLKQSDEHSKERLTRVSPEVCVRSDTRCSRPSVPRVARKVPSSFRNEASEPSKARNPAPRSRQTSTKPKEATNAARCSLHATMCPNEEERALVAVETSDTSPGAQPLCRTPVASPPILGESSSSTTRRLLGKRAVSIDEETSMNAYLPVAKAALMLPKQSPAVSMRATFPRRDNDESLPPLRVASRRLAAANAANTELRAKDDNRRHAKDDSHLSIPSAEAVIQPGIISPSLRETLPPRHTKEIPSSTKKQAIGGKVVSEEEETSAQEHSPIPEAALALSSQPLVSSIRASPSHPPRDGSSHPF
jgi:hypothetical protein